MKHLITISLLAALSFSSGLYAKNNGNDLPNGKPFQNLQSQIDIINLTIAEQKQLFEARFDQVEAQASALAARVAANETDIEALQDYNDIQDSYAAGLRAAIDILESRVNATEDGLAAAALRDQFQDRLIRQLQSQYDWLSQYTTSNVTDLWNRYNSLASLVGSINTRVSTLRSDTATNTSRIASLERFRTSYSQELTALESLLYSYCPYGTVMYGVDYYGSIRCRNVEEFNGISIYSRLVTMTRFDFCDTEVLGVCVDTDYYQSATAYCYSGDRVVGGGYRANGASAHSNYPAGNNGWYVRTFNTGDSHNAGTVYVRCLKTL